MSNYDYPSSNQPSDQGLNQSQDWLYDFLATDDSQQAQFNNVFLERKSTPLDARFNIIPVLNTSFSSESEVQGSTLSASSFVDGTDSLRTSRVSTPLSSPHGTIATSNFPGMLSNGYSSQNPHINTNLLSPSDISSPVMYDSFSNQMLESPLHPNTLDDQFLIPGKVGRYRSNSSVSEASSVAHSPVSHSPLLQSASPILLSSANSPLAYNDDMLSATEFSSLTEQLAGDLSLNDSLGSPAYYSTQESMYQESLGLSSFHSPTQPHHFFNPTSPAPEITIDPPVNSVPTFNNGQTSFDGEESLAPPNAYRGRSHSEADLHQNNDTSGFYSTANSSNVSLSSQNSDGSYLSPGAPEASLRGSHSRHVRSRSSSASQIKERSRSRSKSASREYILELATLAPGSKKIQLNPASFACDLCDKRFTRAYNLRSHKRTHTNERPYVCSVCDKAFARQHDRKRHEALHSGEKKYECKGFLRDGVTTWGCGHKFARADALGRHFRTEAGKECIKSLVDEAEAEKALNNGDMKIYGGNQDAPALMLSPPENNETPNAGSGLPSQQEQQHYFPPALLEQFPMLSDFLH